MASLPITLGVRRKSDTKGRSHKNGFPSKSDVEKVLWRDAFTCRCCGFVSKKFQRVIPLCILPLQASAADNEYVTVCSLCEMTAMLDRAGVTGAGNIIWLPELSQAELNHAVRALYIAANCSDETLKKSATRTLEVLSSRRAEAKKRLGTDDPLILATAFYEQVKAEPYARRAEIMDGLRFLANDRYVMRQNGQEVDVFPQMLAYWTSPEGAFAKLPTSEWMPLFERVGSSAK
jgi:intracellular multiplication protein IcmJ